jgi:hypothetical protein
MQDKKKIECQEFEENWKQELISSGEKFQQLLEQKSINLAKNSLQVNIFTTETIRTQRREL